MAKSELHRDYILELENELQEFEQKADNTTKRMKLLVYPAMIAFFILSAFGFYLIFSLTSDVRRMADTFVNMSGSIETNMDSITNTMTHMSGTMDDMSSSTADMTTDIGKMTNTTSDMSESIIGMKPAIYDMAASTNNMQRDFWSLNKNISTPLSFMNGFLPWKDSQNMPFQGSRAPLPQSYFARPANQAPAGYQNGPYAPIPAPNNAMPPVMVPVNPSGLAIGNQSMMVKPLPLIQNNTYTLK